MSTELRAAVVSGAALAVCAGRDEVAEKCRQMSESRWLRDALRAGAYYLEHGTPRPIQRTPSEALLCAIFGEKK